MLSLSRRATFALRKYSTANSARTPTGIPFPFLPVNVLSAKPDRNKGITEIRGPYYYPVTHTYLNELLSDWGEYVDGIKFAGGSFSLMPEKRLRSLIEVAHKHGALVVHPTHPIADMSFLPRLLCEHGRLHRASLGCLCREQGHCGQVPSQVQGSRL